MNYNTDKYNYHFILQKSLGFSGYAKSSLLVFCNIGSRNIYCFFFITGYVPQKRAFKAFLNFLDNQL